MSAPSPQITSVATIRQKFEDLVRRDLLGPAGGEQEVITEQSVRNRYLLGMLAPLKGTELEEEPLDELADDTEDNRRRAPPNRQMRYTLRLLTWQQFQRAATLMCPCEQIRQSNTARWGETPFRLGPVGGAQDDTESHQPVGRSVEALRSERRPVFSVGSPHQFPACPGCGTPINPGQHFTVGQYPAWRARTHFYCGDSKGQCEYSRRKLRTKACLCSCSVPVSEGRAGA